MIVNIESVSDIDDKKYFAFACFSVSDKDKLKKNEHGFAVVTMDEASNIEIQDITMVIAQSSESA